MSHGCFLDFSCQVLSAFKLRILTSLLGRVTFFIAADGIVKDACSSVVNYNEHVKFVRKMLEAEEKNPKEQNTEETAASGTNAGAAGEGGVQTEGAVVSEENPAAAATN